MQSDATKTLEEEWRLEQRADETLQDFWHAAEDNSDDVPATVKAHRPCMDQHGRLFVRDKKHPSETHLVVPRSRIQHALIMAHNGDDGGHAGMQQRRDSSSISNTKALIKVDSWKRKCFYEWRTTFACLEV